MTTITLTNITLNKNFVINNYPWKDDQPRTHSQRKLTINKIVKVLKQVSITHLSTQTFDIKLNSHT